VNATNAWNVEFSYGFGLLPTLLVEQGVLGALLWIIFFIFLGIIVVRSLRHLPEDPSARFLIISSSAASVFAWLVLILSKPGHVIAAYAFILTGIFIASAVKYGAARPFAISGSNSTRFFQWLVIVLLVLAGLWALIYAKKTVALSYFASGIK